MDREFDKPTPSRLLENGLWRNAKIGPSERGFDCDLPDARGAEQDLVIAAFDLSPDRRPYSIRLTERPQENMRIQQ
jgi:hypothetical protein